MTRTLRASWPRRPRSATPPWVAAPAAGPRRSVEELTLVDAGRHVRGQQAKPAAGDRLVALRWHHTDQPQPRDAAVGIDVQPDQGGAIPGPGPEPVLGVRDQPGPRQQFR